MVPYNGTMVAFSASYQVQMIGLLLNMMVRHLLSLN